MWNKKKKREEKRRQPSKIPFFFLSSIFVFTTHNHLHKKKTKKDEWKKKKKGVLEDCLLFSFLLFFFDFTHWEIFFAETLVNYRNCKWISWVWNFFIRGSPVAYQIWNLFHRKISNSLNSNYRNFSKKNFSGYNRWSWEICLVQRSFFIFWEFERFRILEILNYTFVWTLRWIWVRSDTGLNLVLNFFKLKIKNLNRFINVSMF